MKNLYGLLFLVAICVVAVLITSSIKYIIKAVYKKKGKEFQAKALEYPLAATSFLLAFGSVFALLYFVLGNYIDTNALYGTVYATFNTDNKIIGDLVYSLIYAGFTPLIYTLVQSPRKFIGWIQNLAKKVKDKKENLTINDIKDTLKEAQGTKATEEVEIIEIDEPKVKPKKQKDTA